VEELLLRAISATDDEQVKTLIELLSTDRSSGITKPARSPVVGGTWRLVWSAQADNASALQKFGSRQANSFQIIDAVTGDIQNLVDLGPVQISAKGSCEAASDTRTNVLVTETSLSFGVRARMCVFERIALEDHNSTWMRTVQGVLCVLEEMASGDAGIGVAVG
jgi:hypothetical protein